MNARMRPLVLAACLAAAARGGEMAPEQAFQQLRAYDHGQDRTPLFAIEALVDRSSNDAELREQIAARLVGLLQDGATTNAAKQFICGQLERIGAPLHVPVLAKLLDDAQTGEFARRALQAIPGEAAGAVLLAALPRQKGTALIGLINALGERREAKATEALARLLGDADARVAAAAARALGKMATPEAASALAAAEGKALPQARDAVWAAQLRCAERLAPGAAEPIYQRMWDGDRATHWRLAGLSGLARIREEKALPLLFGALASKDAEVQGTAANLLAARTGSQVAAALAGALPKLDSRGQALAIDILARRGGPEAQQAMVALAASKDETVRVAALRALGSVGDASTVEMLARAAATTEGPVQDAARQALLGLVGKDVDAKLLALAEDDDWRVRIEVLTAITARRSEGAVPALLKAATDGHHLVRLAAFQGLRQMAEAEHYPALVRLVVGAPTVRDVQAAQKSLLAVGRKIPEVAARVDPLLAATKSARPEVKVAALQVLGHWGGPKALAAIREGIKDADPRVQDAAVRALVGWKDRAVAGDLVQLVRGTQNQAHRVLALQAYLRLAREARGESLDESVAMLEQVRDLAKTAASKRLLLATAAELETPRALALAASFVGDADAADEALLATFQLAKALKAAHPEAVRGALSRVLKLSKNPDAIRQANILLGKASFEPLSDGKTLNGWIKPFDWGKAEVVEGAIRLSGEQKFFLVTERTFGDFVLEAEAWLDEGANSGIQYRSHFEKNRLWGYQADVDSLPRGWRGIYDETPGRGWLDRGDPEKAQKLYQQGWNRYRIECIGLRTRFALNGELIADCVDPMEIDGHIALQHHGEKGKVVRYRNLRILDLGKRRWLPLVDEKTIGEWESNGVGKWTVENGAIAGRKTGGGHGLLYSPRQHRDFAVRFKVKAVQGNAGFYLRSEKLPGNQGARGLQVEIDPARDQSGLYETHGRQWVAKPDQEVVRKHFRKGDWNEMAVFAEGGRLVVHLNGHKTVDLANDPGRREGYFGLGVHGGTVHVEFKDVEILSD